MAKVGRPSKFKKHAIYALLDPETRAIRYIGKSVAPKERYAEHIRLNGSRKYPVGRWARDLAKQGTPPAMIILDWVIDWQAAEIKWIARAKRNGCKLLNLSRGGLEMRHVHASNRKYRAYRFLLGKLSKQGLKRKAAIMRAKAAKIRAESGEVGMAAFNAGLRAWCRMHQPFCAGAR